jgi:hypothetical protein
LRKEGRGFSLHGDRGESLNPIFAGTRGGRDVKEGWMLRGEAVLLYKSPGAAGSLKLPEVVASFSSHLHHTTSSQQQLPSPIPKQTFTPVRFFRSIVFPHSSDYFLFILTSF